MSIPKRRRTSITPIVLRILMLVVITLIFVFMAQRIVEKSRSAELVRERFIFGE